MKKISFKILCLSFSFITYSLCNAENVRHDPEALYDCQPNGKRVFNTIRAIGADHTHKKGITGKGTTVAFINMFDPNSMKSLIEEDAIHSAALQDKTFINPNERLDETTIEQLKENLERGRQDYLLSNTEEEKRNTKEKLDQLCLLVRKKEVLEKMNKDKAEASQSPNKISAWDSAALMLNQFHLIAPGAKIIPLDFATLNTNLELYSEIQPGINILNPELIINPNVSLAETLRKAMDYGVDAVFIRDFCGEFFSDKTYRYTDADYDALKEVTQRGIAIVYNGVSSYFDSPMFTSPRREIFEKLEGKGLLFTGGQDYDSWGEEKFDQWSEPELPIKTRFLLAPNRYTSPTNDTDVKLHDVSPANCLAAFSLLKQYTKDRGLPHTTDDLLKILHDSAHDLTHFSKLYKVLDIPNAFEYAEGRRNGSPHIVKCAPKVEPLPVIAPVISNPVSTPVIFTPEFTPVASRLTRTQPSVASRGSSVVARKATPRTGRNSRGTSTKTAAPARRQVTSRTKAAGTAKRANTRTISSKSASLPRRQTRVKPVRSPSRIVRNAHLAKRRPGAQTIKNRTSASQKINRNSQKRASQRKS